MRSHKRLGQTIWILSIVLLVLYPLRHVNVGVDLWDGGYNYANFRYSGLEYMDSMWYFATWLANGIGSLLMRLPFGSTMLGMNVYTGLIVSTTAAVSYFFCVKKLHMPAPLAFVGVMIAISLCWLPTSALYCYLTYLFLLVGSCLLYIGLVSGKGGLLIAAGVVLGLNVGNRFSNLVQAGLILVVWAYGIFDQRKFSRVVKDTGLCILGYVAGFGSLLLIISIRYGIMEYVAGIGRLFQMTEKAVDYKPSSMLLGAVSAYLGNENTYWIKRFLLLFGCGCLVCLPFPGKWERLKKGVSILITAGGIIWLTVSGFGYRDFTFKEAVYAPCVMMFQVMILLTLFQIFRKNVSSKDRLFATLLLLTVFLTPLGSNNAMYTNINNSFLMIPGFLWLGWNFCRSMRQMLAFPIKCVIFSVAFFVLFRSAGFGAAFVYEEAVGGRGLEVEISQIPVLEGMRTNQQKAENLEDLYGYLSQEDLTDRECILYGYIPGVAYFMELEPSINTWGDLRSYAPEVMQADLDRVKREMDSEAVENPLVILERRHADYLESKEAEGLFYDEQAKVKLQMLQDFMEELGYKSTYYNEGFVVYWKEK